MLSGASTLLFICSPGRSRTGTALAGRGILSPLCLPISPRGHLDINIGFEPITFSASDALSNFLFGIPLKSFSTFFTDVLPLN